MTDHPAKLFVRLGEPGQVHHAVDRLDIVVHRTHLDIGQEREAQGIRDPHIREIGLGAAVLGDRQLVLDGDDAFGFPGDARGIDFVLALRHRAGQQHAALGHGDRDVAKQLAGMIEQPVTDAQLDLGVLERVHGGALLDHRAGKHDAAADRHACGSTSGERKPGQACRHHDGLDLHLFAPPQCSSKLRAFSMISRRPSAPTSTASKRQPRIGPVSLLWVII